jgi:sugar transferase (PEP-CTERM/EpsH1 system associated)
MTGETLFIAHRIPFPPDRGDKIRSHHLLKALAALGPVHVATLGETPGDFAAEPLLAQVAASYCLAQRSGSLPLAGIRALATGKTVSLTAFDSPRLHAWIADVLATRPIDTVVVFSGQMGQYVPASFAGRTIIDLCDVDSAKFEAYARDGKGPRSWVDAREGRLLAAEEARLARRADTVLLISEAEANLFRERAGLPSAKVRSLGNGIDTELYDPRSVSPPPALHGEPGPHVVFTGQMDYPPNIAAVRRTAEALMPAIRAVQEDAVFHIVGRAPVAEVRALEGRHGTRVWGEVPDVRPFLAGADLVVAPLTIARGVQNKVLEAMSMARPVLLTPEAATGIGAAAERHFCVAGSDAELIEAALRLLDDKPTARAMGEAARRFVVEHKSWASALAALPEIVGKTPAVARDAA